MDKYVTQKICATTAPVAYQNCFKQPRGEFLPVNSIIDNALIDEIVRYSSK